MEGGHPSSKPPGYPHHLDLELELQRVEGSERINDISPLSRHSSSLGIKPLAKARTGVGRTIMTGIGRISSDMISTHAAYACSKGDGKNSDMGFDSKSNTAEETEVLEPSELVRQRNHESGEMPAAHAEVEDAEDSRERLSQTFMDELDADTEPVMAVEAALTEEEEEEEENVDRIEHIKRKLRAVYESGDRKAIKSKKHLKKLEAQLIEFSDLYDEGTLDAHMILVERLVQEGFLADMVYDRIHRDRKLRFSRFEKAKPNDFVRHLVATGRIKTRAVLLELGPGGGEDARHIVRHVPRTRVIGVDISQYAVEAANRISKKRGLDERVKFRHGNYLDSLRHCRGHIDGVYTHSTAQYRPRKVQEEIVFRRIADALQKTRGLLYMAMKIGPSASAHSPLQIELAHGTHRDNPKIDLRQNGCFRVYPETEEDVHSLLTPSGLVVEDSQVVPYFSYDREGETEWFCQLVARAG